MKTNRIKSTLPAIRTREDMENLVGEIAEIKISHRLLIASMDEQLQAIRAHFEPQMAAHDKALDQKMEHARAWADANPLEFGAARSLETLHGTVGWRTGGPALRTLAGWDWDRVKDSLKHLGAIGYIRVKEEVNKQNLIADRESIGPEKLKELGLRVVQESSFFVEPKLTSLPELAPRG